MKIALINGSPKPGPGASSSILADLEKVLPPCERLCFHFFRPAVEETELKKLALCDIFVFSFPLYVDGIPSHLLSCLTQLEDRCAELASSAPTVYGIVNCGFYEGRQCLPALEMLRNWCRRCGLHWGRGLAVGAGGMLAGLSVPAGHGPKKNLGRSLKAFSQSISAREGGDVLVITANFPRFLYKWAGQAGFHKQAKENGLTKEDLCAKIQREPD